MLKKTDKILIAGQEGMVGSAVYRLLKKNKYKIIECKRNDLNFLDLDNFFSLILIIFLVFQLFLLLIYIIILKFLKVIIF
jgi:nucleoside-diphosphate-sugar epimerase